MEKWKTLKLLYEGTNRSCYLDNEDYEKYRVFRLYCRKCREVSPHILCVDEDPTDPSNGFPVLICEKCQNETFLTKEEHDKVLEGKDYDDI